MAGSLIFLAFVCMAILAPQLSPYDPRKMDIPNRLSSPSRTHLLGTDKIGRDILSRAIFGTRHSMLIGIAVVIGGLGIGGILGMVAGFHRYADNVIMRILDGMMAFPSMLLAIAVMAALGSSVVNVIFALTIVYMPRIARVIRSSVLIARELTYVEAAKAVGTPTSLILYRHILPNIFSPAIVQATFVFAFAILNETALSFLGVGVPPMTPTWGNILNEAMDVYQIAYWYMVGPGVFVVLAVYAINMVGDGLRDTLDPVTARRHYTP